MRNKSNRRYRRLETPSPAREIHNTKVETFNTGNETLTNSNNKVQEGLGDGISQNQFTEPGQISSEIQIWARMFEQKNNGRIINMREELDNKL